MNNKFTFSVAGLVKDDGFSRRPEATYIRRESKDLSEAVAIASNPLTARLIARKVNAHDALLEALKALTAEIHLSRLNIRKDFNLISAHAAATKAIWIAEGGKP